MSFLFSLGFRETRMVFENGEELSEDRTPILDERDSVSYEEFGGDQVRNYSK